MGGWLEGWVVIFYPFDYPFSRTYDNKNLELIPKMSLKVALAFKIRRNEHFKFQIYEI